EQFVTTSDLRAYLKERLPEYMVPSAIVMLDQLPLTPNGKVNRSALSRPDESPSPDGAPFVAPRTVVEELLAGIWMQVLSLESIGVEDNFFELGGHSLLATQALSRIRDTFGVEVALRKLFLEPTVAGLAQAVEVALRDGNDSGETALARREKAGGLIPL